MSKPGGQSDHKELGFYFALGQVGLEMVVPIVIGIAIDTYLNWTPWATVSGAVLGLFGGLAHLVILLNQQDRSAGSDQGKE
ncbi:MAG TPA: AtpZ/AtpI family protein [Gemmataceae bacterium]|nr:AtpZ/AtpI family protein [Gemmataceae bacterium]